MTCGSGRLIYFIKLVLEIIANMAKQAKMDKKGVRSEIKGRL